MNEQRYVEFIAGTTTPAEWLPRVGYKWPLQSGQIVPGPGWEGKLGGCPGIMREDYRFEIADVDMRSPEAKLLDEAAEILRMEPEPGEFIEDVEFRHARAQHLLLRAQIAILRRQL